MKVGDRLAEWDPVTLPIITEQSGVVKYQDLVEGTTLEEQTDDATGIAQRVVTDPPPGVIVMSMAPYSINYLAFGYVREFGDSFRVKSELYQMVRDAFQLHGIVIPFPRQDITVAADNPAVKALLAKSAGSEQSAAPA